MKRFRLNAYGPTRPKSLPLVHVVILVLLLCSLLFSACGIQEDPGISEKRTVEFSQLFNEENRQFSLDGYAPGVTSAQLQETNGYLQEEPIVFHGLSAKAVYSYTGDRLYRVTYEIAAAAMSQSQWDSAASLIYNGVLGEFDPFSDLETFQSGSLKSQSGITSTWYAKAANDLSMLTFSAIPPTAGEGSDNSSTPTISITITADLPAELTADRPEDFPESNLVSASYLSHFPPADEEMVNAADFIPGVFVDLMYARSDNFTGQVIYDFHTAYLRYGTVKKLIGVQKKLHLQGYSLKICDAFRPVSAQFKLWEIVPDPNFVADPYHGYSTHSRGNTVDLDLVTVDGAQVEMPTPVDTFSPLADRDYSDVSEAAANHALILQNAMVEAGFKTSSVEWWHYYDKVSYPVAEDFEPGKESSAK